MSIRNRHACRTLFLLFTVLTVSGCGYPGTRSPVPEPPGANVLIYDLSTPNEGGADASTVKTIERRLQALQLSGVYVESPDAGRVVARFDGDSEVVARARRVVERRGIFSLHLVAEVETATVRPGNRTVPLRLGDEASGSTVPLETGPASSLLDIRVAAAAATLDAFGAPAVSVELADSTGRALGDLTESNVGRRLALVIDGEALCVPTIQSRVGTPMQLSGNFSSSETEELAAVLAGGQLPGVPRLLEVTQAGQ